MKKILVIEDDREINNLICEFLSENGYETVSARDGITGLRKFENEKSVDLVILDLMLPYKSGDGVLSEIRRMSNIPVIVTSAKDMIQTKVDIMRLGADDYITKPFDLDELLVRIEAVLRRCSGADIRLAATGNGNKTYAFKNLVLDDSLKVHMSNIRNKIKKYDSEEYIETVWGMGYKIKSEKR